MHFCIQSNFSFYNINNTLDHVAKVMRLQFQKDFLVKRFSVYNHTIPIIQKKAGEIPAFLKEMPACAGMTGYDTSIMENTMTNSATVSPTPSTMR